MRILSILLLLCGSAACPQGPKALPTCDDGILNGDEVETDCGGPDCGLCPDWECADDPDCRDLDGPCTDGLCDPDEHVCIADPLPEGTPCGSLFDSECDGADTCDGAGTCLPNLTPNGTPCDDGDACFGVDECFDGSCTSDEPCPACPRSSECKVVEGRCMCRVPMMPRVSGETVCFGFDMRCSEAPVLTDPVAACLAFHPGAQVTSDFNGWRQAVYCDLDQGLACEGRQSCHHCPACGPFLNCGTSNSALLTEMYVECVAQQ